MDIPRFKTDVLDSSLVSMGLCLFQDSGSVFETYNRALGDEGREVGGNGPGTTTDVEDFEGRFEMGEEVGAGVLGGAPGM